MLQEGALHHGVVDEWTLPPFSLGGKGLFRLCPLLCGKKLWRAGILSFSLADKHFW